MFAKQITRVSRPGGRFSHLLARAPRPSPPPSRTGPLAAAGLAVSLAVTPCPQCGWGPLAGSGGGRLPGSLPHPELQRSLGPRPAHRPGAGWLRNPLLGSGLICSSPPTGRPHPTLPAGSQAPKCPNRPILRPEHGSQGPLSPTNLPRCEFPWEGTGLVPELLGPLPFALSAGGGGKAGHFEVPCGRWGCQCILRTDPDILDWQVTRPPKSRMKGRQVSPGTTHQGHKGPWHLDPPQDGAEGTTLRGWSLCPGGVGGSVREGWEERGVSHL